MLINPFLKFLIQQTILHKNFLIIVNVNVNVLRHSINETIQPDPSLIQFWILYKISWKAFSRLNLWFITFFDVELKQVGLNSISILGLYFFNITFSVIWYLKPLLSFKRSLNKSLILDLLSFNCLIGSFFSII